ncbi:MAG: lamin tail domain-containing protein, partial [Planctomycetales bacterium]|nr:lamin tail domain-containing protein [Planctomycetales bacterium]
NLAEGGAAGRLQRGPYWSIDTQRGIVLNVDGQNDYVDAGTLPAISVNDDFTWSFWFRPKSVPNEDGVIVGNRDTGDGTPFVRFSPSKFEYVNGGTADPAIAYPVTVGKWAHFAVVKQGPTLNYYVNGELIGSGVTTHDMPETAFYLGGAPNAAGEVAAGALDDVAVWTKALPLQAVQGLARGVYSPLDAPTAVLVGPIVPGDLPTEHTTLAADATTYYFRREFKFEGETAGAKLQLNFMIDDGAVFYLNGQEIYRENMPAGAVNATTPATSQITEIGATGWITVPATALVRGDNVLAIEVHKNGGANDDAFLAFELQATAVPIDPASVLMPVLNEISAASDANFQVELYNPHDVAIDLAGYQLAGETLPSLTIGAHSYATLTRAQLGGQGSTGDGDELFLIAPDGVTLADAQRISGRLRGRDATSGDNWYYPTSKSFGAANVFDVQRDIVINEIMYHAPGFYVGDSDKLYDNDEQWIELFNRSTTSTIDLSGWTFGAGLNFDFPLGTKLAPQSYLVIAQDPAMLLAEHPELSDKQVLGPFVSRLSNSGENIELLDRSGNLVDNVHYYDSGRWSQWADGGGSSLELRNPFSDNNAAESWAASEEYQQVDWQTIRLRGTGRSITSS